MKFNRVVVWAWLFLWLAPCQWVMACPNCKNAAADTNPFVAQGFGASIVIMLLIPTAIVMCWIVAFFRLRSETTQSPRNRQVAEG